MKLVAGDHAVDFRAEARRPGALCARDQKVVELKVAAAGLGPVTRTTPLVSFSSGMHSSLFALEGNIGELKTGAAGDNRDHEHPIGRRAEEDEGRPVWFTRVPGGMAQSHPTESQPFTAR